MKAIFKISIGLNLILIGGLIFIQMQRRKETVAATPVSAQIQLPVQTSALPIPSPVSEPDSRTAFNWRQLESTNGYRIYLANLRAIGCPEPTIEDIAHGDTERAFAWERRRLKLDGSGNGPWSRTQATQLVANLLQSPAGNAAAVEAITENQTGQTASGATEVSAITQTAAPPAYPLFLQNVDWNAQGFDAGQQSAIAQVRQQFLNTVNGTATGPNDFTGRNSDNQPAVKLWQAALQDANNQLNGLLGSQAYAAYEQQQYLKWFQPQATANTDGENLNIDPGAFSMQ